MMSCQCLKEIKVYKSPGLDGITERLLKVLCRTAKSCVFEPIEHVLGADVSPQAVEGVYCCSFG